MESASEDLRNQFAGSSQNEKPQQEETIVSLRTRLAGMEQQRQPKPGMHYKIDDIGIRQASDEKADQEALKEMQNIRRRIMETEQDQRRSQFMLQRPDMGPEEEPEPEPAET